LPGMYLTGVVETGGVLVPALPDGAVVDFQGKKHLFVLVEGNQVTGEESQNEASVANPQGRQFQMVEVHVGHNELGYTEVIVPDNFNKERQVVIKGSYAILSKLKNTEVIEE